MGFYSEHRESWGRICGKGTDYKMPFCLEKVPLAAVCRVGSGGNCAAQMRTKVA